MAERIAEYAHPAVVFWPVNSAVKVTGTFERTDCTGWHRRGLGSHCAQLALLVVGNTVAAAISEAHLIVARSVTVVTFGSAGSAPV